jgi:glycosyltransferase involved in cell wall biosynthesis
MLSADHHDRSSRVGGLGTWYREIYRRWSSDPSIALVHCHGLASLPISVALKLRLGVPLLYDAHELETERHGWSFKTRLVAKIVERALIGFADHSIVVGESILDWYRKAYPGKPFSLVRNLPVFAPPGGGGRSLRQEAGIPESDLLCVYLGVLGRGRGIEELIETFRRLPEDKHMAFVGFGELADLVKAAARERPNIHYFDALPWNEVVDFIRSADLGIFLSASDALNEHFVAPNKMFEYATAGLALLCNDSPDMRAFIDKHRLGWTFDGAIDGAVAKLNSLDPAEVRAYSREEKPPLPTWESEKGVLVGLYREMLGK